MRAELKLPRYGTSMEEGTIARWLKAAGERFQKADPLCEIETEKVTTTYEAPLAGLLLEILAPAGSVLAVGGVLCRVETDLD